MPSFASPRSLAFAFAALVAALPAAVSADPAAEVAARHAYFDSLGAQMKTLGALAKSFDPAAARAAAADLAPILATEFRTLFPAGTSAADLPGESRAKPGVWTDFDAFLTREKALKDAGGALVAAADAGDGPAFAAGFRQMGMACKACHDAYRAAK